MASSLVSQLTASFAASSLASLSDDDVFDDSTGTSPNGHHPMQFQFHPSQIAQFHQSTLQQAQSQLQLQHIQQQQQQQQQLFQHQQQQQHHQQQQQQQQQPPTPQQPSHPHPHPQQHPLLLQHSRYPQYRPPIAQFPQATPHPYVSPIYPIIDPWDAWLSLSPYSQPRSPMFDFTGDPWTPPNHHHPRTGQRRKKSSGSSHASPAERKPEEVDVTTLAPREAILKAKVRLANLLEWKTYTKNNAWTPEVVLGEPFKVPINIKFLQLVPTAQYLISLGFALREDTPGLMSFSEESLQWNSIEGAVHQAPRKSGKSDTSQASDKVKMEIVLSDAPPSNTMKLNGGKPLTGADLMETPRQFNGLVVSHQPEKPNQIQLRPNYKYSPCLFISLVTEEDSSQVARDDDGTIYKLAYTRKVMIHDIKMVPVERIHNPMLGANISSSDSASSTS